MEIWKPIVDLEEFYEISNLGNVRSKIRIGFTNYGQRTYGGKNVKPFLTSVGYLAVNLTKKGYRKQFHIHKLVLEAFVGKKPDNMEACHNNGKKNDNSLENLRWDTRKNNHKDQLIHGTKIGNKRKLNFELVKQIRKDEGKYSDLAKKYNISICHLWSIKKNKVWKNDN